MNDDFIDNRELQSFEAELAAVRPQISQQEKDRILFASAFAAGQSQSFRSLLPWKLFSGVLSALLITSSTLLITSHLQMAELIANRITPASNGLPHESPKPAQTEPIVTSPHRIIAKLDSWQLPSSSGESLGRQIEQFQKLEPRIQSVSVSAMTRNAQTRENSF